MRRITEEKMEEETSLLEFTRQVVDLICRNHSDPHVIFLQHAMLLLATLEAIRFDVFKHYVRMSTVSHPGSFIVSGSIRSIKMYGRG
jgi:hypothetical protein